MKPIRIRASKIESQYHALLPTRMAMCHRVNDALADVAHQQRRKLATKLIRMFESELTPLQTEKAAHYYY